MQKYLSFSRLFLSVSLLVAVMGTSPSMTVAQEPAAAQEKQKSELAVLQRQAERMLTEVEARFTAAAERMRKEDPEKADRLIKTYQKSKEESLTKKMALASSLMDEGSFAEAKQELVEIITVVDAMIRVLTNEKEKVISKKDEIENLEKFRNELRQRLEEQRKQTKENEKVSNKEDAVKNLKAQIKRLEGLVKDQTENLEKTRANLKSGLRELDKIADKQFEIRKETERLAQNIRDQNFDKPGDSKASVKANEESDGDSGKPGDGEKAKPGDKDDKDLEEELKELQKKKAELQKKLNESGGDKDSKGDPKNGSKKDSAGKPSGGKPSDGKPSDGKPSDEKKDQDQKGQDGKQPADGDKKSESKKGSPQKGQSGQSGQSGKSGKSGKSGQSQPGQKSQQQQQQQQQQQPGSKPLDKAAEHQRKAEEKLASGSPKDAARQQELAKQEIEKALAEVKKEMRRLESLPPEAIKRLADDQRRTRKKTMDVLEKMKKAPTSKPEQGQQQGGQKNQAGQKPTEQAGGAMKKAADDLQKNDSEQAKRNQQKAEEKLEEAIEELEERLKQLREETREEKLARLEARFAEMLQRQQVASVMTTELDDKKINLGQLRRRDQLVTLRVATEELQIRELGQQAYDLLIEDGSSKVFPEVVEELKIDLERAGRLLQDEKTDRYTQLVQKEIETTIEDLIDALQEAQKKGGGGGGGGGGDGKQPLLKKSAELKILRMKQRRLNRRTKKLEQMRDNAELADILKQERGNAERIQLKIIEMTERIMEESQ